MSALELIMPDPVLLTLPIDRVRPNPMNGPDRWRGDEEDDALVANIRAHNVLQPIIVTGDGEGTFLIIAGERRWRAARLAGLDRIPAVLQALPGGNALQERVLMLSENFPRRSLAPWEAMLALEDSVVAHRRQARTAGKAEPSVEVVAETIGMPKALAARCWTVVGLLDEATRTAIAGNPRLRQGITMADLSRVGRLPTTERPALLEVLAAAAASPGGLKRARRVDPRPRPPAPPAIRYAVRSAEQQEMATAVVVPDPTRGAEAVYTPSLGLQIRLHPLVDMSRSDERAQVAREIRTLMEQLIVRLEAGELDVDALQDGAGDEPIAVVPTDTYRDLAEISGPTLGQRSVEDRLEASRLARGA